jgi:hypothetical protein
MTESKTERGTCRFIAELGEGGKPVLRVQLFHDSVSLLKNAELGFNLLSGVSLQQAKKIADDLNDKVLDLSIRSLSMHTASGTK